MILKSIYPPEGLINSLLTWLVDNRFIITLLILGALAFLLLLVAVRLFRHGTSRPAPLKTRPQPAASRTGIAATLSSSTWQLVDVSGQTIPLLPLPFTIGRAAGNTLVLDDPSVASQHARILNDPDWNGLVIEDLNSPTGILVEEKPTCKNMLQPGVRLQIGRYAFVLNQKTP